MVADRDRVDCECFQRGPGAVVNNQAEDGESGQISFFHDCLAVLEAYGEWMWLATSSESLSVQWC